jgi:hypothetical protein
MPVDTNLFKVAELPPEILEELLTDSDETIRAYGRLVETGFFDAWNLWQSVELGESGGDDDLLLDILNRTARANTLACVQLVGQLVLPVWSANDLKRRRELLNTAMTIFEEQLVSFLEAHEIKWPNMTKPRSEPR